MIVGALVFPAARPGRDSGIAAADVVLRAAEERQNLQPRQPIWA